MYLGTFMKNRQFSYQLIISLGVLLGTILNASVGYSTSLEKPEGYPWLCHTTEHEKDFLRNTGIKPQICDQFLENPLSGQSYQDFSTGRLHPISAAHWRSDVIVLHIYADLRLQSIRAKIEADLKKANDDIFRRNFWAWLVTQFFCSQQQEQPRADFSPTREQVHRRRDEYYDECLEQNEVICSESGKIIKLKHLIQQEIEKYHISNKVESDYFGVPSKFKGLNNAYDEYTKKVCEVLTVEAQLKSLIEAQQKHYDLSVAGIAGTLVTYLGACGGYLWGRNST